MAIILHIFPLYVWGWGLGELWSTWGGWVGGETRCVGEEGEWGGGTSWQNPQASFYQARNLPKQVVITLITI